MRSKAILSLVPAPGRVSKRKVGALQRRSLVVNRRKLAVLSWGNGMASGPANNAPVFCFLAWRPSSCCWLLQVVNFCLQGKMLPALIRALESNLSELLHFSLVKCWTNHTLFLKYKGSRDAVSSVWQSKSSKAARMQSRKRHHLTEEPIRAT